MTSNPYRLAKCLARPVARGWLSHEDAEDCLLAEVLAARRCGTLGPYDPVTVYGGLRWILGQYLAAEEVRRDLAAVRIRYRIKPLLAVRKPPNALLAEAHDVNGAAGFPLTEREITDCVAMEVYHSLPAGARAMFDDTPVARIMTVYEEGGTKRDVLIASQKAPEPPPEPFALKSIRILEPKAIPHRQWLYGNHLIRGFVTLLIAPGGTGKSSVALAMCMSLAINRSILGPHIFQQCNAALLNLEDPQEEIDRRIAALAIRYGITNEDIKGRFFVAPAERGVRIASYGPDGFSIVHPDEDQIVDQLIAQNIGVLGVDPFAESHTLEENSNPQMVQASAAWRRVARKANCAVLLTHHVRKGLVDNIEAARGAKALTDSARVGLLLSTMTDEEAKALGVPEGTRLQYVRLDDAKANMAARAPKAAWFHLGHVTLDNSDDVYANGDNVVVVEPWKPASVWEAITPEEANDALNRIAAGIDGEPCTDSRRGGAERWAGRIIVEMFHYSEEQAAEVIRVWIMNGVLEKEMFMKGRKERTALRVNDIKRPGMLHERNAP